MTRVVRGAKWIIGVVILSVLAVVAWNIFFHSSASTPVRVGDAVISAQVVSTEEDRQRGLSGVRQLAENRGMLFVYDREDRWGIWMRDMHVDLDIIWLDANQRVVHIVKNVSPNTYPQTFRPDRPAQYVLEVSAGTVDRRNIAIGDEAQFELRPEQGV